MHQLWVYVLVNAPGPGIQLITCQHTSIMDCQPSVRLIITVITVSLYLGLGNLHAELIIVYNFFIYL